MDNYIAYAAIAIIIGCAIITAKSVIRDLKEDRERERKREQDYQEAWNRRAEQARIELARLRAETPDGPIRSNSPPKRTVPQKPTKYVGADPDFGTNQWGEISGPFVAHTTAGVVDLYAQLDSFETPAGPSELITSYQARCAELVESTTRAAEACNAQSFAPDSGYSCAPDTGSSCDSGGSGGGE